MNNDTGIYSITSPSGRRYIGSAASFRRRWSTHLCSLRAGKHHSPQLQRAFNKYGEGALKFEKLALCPITDLIVTEQEFIDRLKPEYNVCPVAGSTQGLKLGPHSAEHRRKIGESQRGKIISDEQRKLISEVHKGKRLSAEHIASMSRLNSGAGNPFYGKKHAPGTIERVSGWRHHSAVPVYCVETGMVFPSVQGAVDWLRSNGRPSASRSPIRECCLGSTRYKRPYGFTWRSLPTPE